MIRTSKIRMDWTQWNHLHTSLQFVETRNNPLHRRELRPNLMSDCYIATWVIKGSIRRKDGIQQIDAHNGDWIFQRPGATPVERLAGTSWIDIYFYFHWTGEGQILWPSKQNVWKTGPLPVLEEQTRLLCKTIAKHRHSTNPLIRVENTTMHAYLDIRQQFHLWFMTCLEEWSRQQMSWGHVRNMDEKVVQTLRHIEHSPLDQAINIEEIARKFGISSNRLSVLFRKECGMAPGQYRMKLKLQAAINALQENGGTIDQIAARLGYSRVRFHIWIKQQTGKTPMQIRKDAQTGITPQGIKGTRREELS